MQFYYQSFLFSQGREPLQKYFFTYFAVVEPKLHTRGVKYDKQLSRGEIVKLLPPKHGKIADNLDEYRRLWDELFTLKPPINQEDLLDPILALMLERDIYHQQLNRRIPLAGDEHYSQVREYILNGRKCHPIFRQLFTDLKTLFMSDEYQNSDSILVQRMVSLWEEKHPGQLFFPESADHNS